jgi:hypothetical protein
VDVLGRLREGVPREPDAIDLLRERRAARLRAAAARRGAAPNLFDVPTNEERWQ